MSNVIEANIWMKCLHAFGINRHKCKADVSCLFVICAWDLKRNWQSHNFYQICVCLSVWEKRRRGRAVSASDFGSWGRGFEYRWRQDSSRTQKAFHCTEPFVFTFHRLENDWNPNSSIHPCLFEVLRPGQYYWISGRGKTVVSNWQLSFLN